MIRGAIPPQARILAACGLAVGVGATHPVLGQSDPLAEPFGSRFELETLLPSEGGDGSLGVVFDGVSRLDSTGQAVAIVGDINGDGLADLLIAAPWADFGPGDDAGSIYVVFGRREPWQALLNPSMLDGRVGFRIDGPEGGARAGWSVAGAGDANGDGIDDILIGGPYIQNQNGAAFLIFGRPASEPWPAVLSLAGLRSNEGTRLIGWRDGPFADSFAGRSVSGGGDINGDGLDDIVVGTNRNAACIVYGPVPGGTIDLRTLAPPLGFRASAPDDNPGLTVAIASDINGDGLDDLLLGSPSSLGREYCYTTYSCSTFKSGRAFVLLGRDAASDPFSNPEILVPGLASGTIRMSTGAFDARLGSALAGAGDINGDGFADFVVGSPGTSNDPYGSPFPSVDDGEAHVVFGRPRGAFPPEYDLKTLDGGDGLVLRFGSYDRAARSVAAAGDINNDGIDDLMVSRDSGGGPGVAHVIFGRTTGFPAVLRPGTGDGVLLIGINDGDRTGFAVGGGGDVNGDGVPDMLVGAVGADLPGQASAGRAFIVFGRGVCGADLDGDGALTLFDFLAFQNLFDAGSPRADFDGDGALTIFDFLAFQNAFDAGCD
ncbi:MAG: GC-type dockerin domain-anchored protein [Phycisphaerales bacterium]